VGNPVDLTGDAISAPGLYKQVMDKARDDYDTQVAIFGDPIPGAFEQVTPGAGELVVNSIDADGTQAGYELTLTRMISEAVSIPVIASGGAGTPEHLYEVLTAGHADAALIASMVHYGTYSIQEIKDYLRQRGIPMRLHW